MRFEQVTAIEGFGLLFALLFFALGELGLPLVVGNRIAAGDPRVALLQAANGFVHLDSRP
jgi:hypothetical protein